MVLPNLYDALFFAVCTSMIEHICLASDDLERLSIEFFDLIFESPHRTPNILMTLAHGVHVVVKLEICLATTTDYYVPQSGLLE